MGNGFTFQLESLIFYAVAVCCCEKLGLPSHDIRVHVNAYGDDVILPSACFDLFSEMVTFYGFRINYSKSFSNSPFRESCGAHYFSGIDIKPVYLKDRLSSIQTIYRLANAVRRFAHRRMNFMACDQTFRPVFDHLVSRVPKALRLRIPETLGDGGFVSNFDESTPSMVSRSAVKRHRLRGYEGIVVPNLIDVSKTYEDDRPGYLLASLWGMSKRPETGNYSLVEHRTVLEALTSLTLEPSPLERNSVPRKMDLRARLVMSTVQQWYDMGPWI